ncbi:MAG: hypothetical protein JKY15_02660 [Deltaproteobacteria bacterium]|nr:hypothetical protein [Deltaproteobacteria bacterium]
MNIEVYAPGSEIEAQRILGFLKSEGIEASMETRDPLPQMPTTHQYIILTTEESRQKAIELIANARLDQVITDTGTFL